MSDTTNSNDAADPEAGLTVEDAGTTTDAADLAGGDEDHEPEKASDLGS